MPDPDFRWSARTRPWLGLDWAADFDPADFRLDDVNARLSQLT